jgi:hypothetical protein
MIALLLLIGLLLYIFLAWSVVRVVGWLASICAFTSVTKRVLQVLCAAFFVLVPTWDIIPSRLYFQHLCEQEAGVNVYRSVKIGQSYFRPDGKPDDKKLLERYAQSSKWNHSFSSWAHIIKIEGTIQDKQTGEILGTTTDFVYYGGWLGSRIAAMSSVTCPNYPNHSIHSIVWQEIFKLTQSSLPEEN